MASIVKGLLLIIFFAVIFGQNYIKSKFLYWSLYAIMFMLIPAFGAVMFWVSKKRAEKVLGKTPEADFFVGKVSANVSDDLQRGRLCFHDGMVDLIQKSAKGYDITWSRSIDEIKSVSFGTVAGVRKGFTFHFSDDEVSFTSGNLFRNHQPMYKALGWEINTQNS